MPGIRFWQLPRWLFAAASQLTVTGDVVKAECPDLFQECKLTDIMWSPQCLKCFTVLPRSNPHVMIKNLRALITQHHLPKVHSLVCNINMITLHPKDGVYAEEMHRLNVCDNSMEGSCHEQPTKQQPNGASTPPVAPSRFGCLEPVAASAVG